METNKETKVPKRIKIKCDKCNKEYEWSIIYNGKFKGEVRENYTLCPHCGDKHVLSYENAIVRGFIGLIADTKNDMVKETSISRKEGLEEFLKLACKNYHKQTDKLKNDIDRIGELEKELYEYKDTEQILTMEWSGINE